MEPQPPPAPSPAALAHQHQHQHQHQHHQPHRTSRDARDLDATYSEKDAFQRQSIHETREERGSKGSNRSNGRSHDSVISHPFSPKASSPPSPSSSISSGRKYRSIPEIQPAAVNVVAVPERAYLDPEKAHHSAHGSVRSPNRVSTSNPDVTAVVYGSGEYHEKGPEEKPVQLLLFLSGPCALLSFVIAIWTVFCLLIAVALQPFRLCTKRPSLSQQLTAFLAPPLNLQLHIIYSYSSATDYSPAMLVIIHLFSPVVSIGVAIAAWTAAFFWFFSMILGDPGGQDGHNDGKDSILGVRNWWDRWLSRGLR